MTDSRLITDAVDDYGKALVREALEHAEAIAAKLVEVICDMNDDHQIDEQALRYVRNQRDAARAEVAKLQEVTDHRWQQFREQQREAISLRARVEELCRILDDHEAETDAEVAALREKVKNDSSD